MGTALPPGKLTVVPDAEVFATGKYDQGEYTVRDLCQMASNVNRLGPNGHNLHSAPLGLLNSVGVGHEDIKTDEPAYGVVRKARVKSYYDPATKQWEAILVADLDDVPEDLAEAIRKKKYRKVSAEIYDNFSDDHGRKYGKAIRRVSLLGFEPPQVKRLKDLPQPVQKYSERWTPLKRVQRSPGIYVCFAERKPMDNINADAIKIAVKSELPTMDDGQLDAIAKAVMTVMGATPPADVAPPADAVMADMDMSTDTVMEETDGLDMRQKLIDELVGLGHDPATLETMSDEDLQALLDASKEGPAVTDEDVATMGEYSKKMFSEIKRVRATFAKELKAAKDEVAKFKKFAEDLKKEQIDIILTDALRSGRLLPSQRETYATTLAKADRNTVKTFGEGKSAVKDTEYNRIVTWLRTTKPVAVFSEKLPQPAVDNAGMDEETLKVKKFAEAKFGGNATEVDVAAYITKFQKIREKDNRVTAEQYTGAKL